MEEKENQGKRQATDEEKRAKTLKIVDRVLMIAVLLTVAVLFTVYFIVPLFNLPPEPKKNRSTSPDGIELDSAEALLAYAEEHYGKAELLSTQETGVEENRHRECVFRDV